MIDVEIILTIIKQYLGNGKLKSMAKLNSYGGDAEALIIRFKVA